MCEQLHSPLGNKIIEINGLKKAWGDKKIINDFTYTFKKKDRIGIVGKNGAGKTTFLQLLTGLEKPDAGTIDPGETLVVGYYTQIPFDFKPEQRVIDTITEIAEVIPYGKNESLSPSQFLSKFLFPPPPLQMIAMLKLRLTAKMKKKVKTMPSPWRPQSRRRERALMASSKRVIAQFEPSSFRHMSALRITDCTSQRPPTLSQCGPNRSRQVQCRSRTPLETLRVNLTLKHIKSCISEGVR